MKQRKQWKIDRYKEWIEFNNITCPPSPLFPSQNTALIRSPLFPPPSCAFISFPSLPPSRGKDPRAYFSYFIPTTSLLFIAVRLRAAGSCQTAHPAVSATLANLWRVPRKEREREIEREFEGLPERKEMQRNSRITAWNNDEQAVFVCPTFRPSYFSWKKEGGKKRKERKKGKK